MMSFCSFSVLKVVGSLFQHKDIHRDRQLVNSES